MTNFPFFVKTVGRRKLAMANLALLPGSGYIQVNGGPAARFFVSHQDRLAVVQLPFVVAAHLNFDAEVNVLGGGLKGQAVSLQLALFRALASNQPKNRNMFRKKGFLTRDSRRKERRKYGLKKARKAPQFSKR